MSDMEWHRVIERDSLDESRPRLGRAGAQRVAIYLAGDDVFATANRCPHAAASLGLGAYSPCVVTCPRHEWQFDVRTGECITNPGWTVRTYDVRVVDGWVEVGIEGDDRPTEDELMGFITE